MEKSGIRKKKMTGMVLAVLMAVMLNGCGNSSKSEYASEDTAAATAYNASMDGGLYEAMPQEAAAAAEEAGTDAEIVQKDSAVNSRKLIKNVDMGVETKEFDTLLSNVEQKVAQLGGYLEQSNINNGSYSSNFHSRSASLTARIPADRLDLFLSDVAEWSNITYKNEYVEDVTLQYVDLESHKKALQAEQESLLSMLEQAQSIEDIIAINEQLTDVRYRLESMESQLRTYDNKIQYSTVYLYIDEVERYEPVAAKSAGERIKEGFVRNLHKVGDGISNFCIEFVIALPIILTFAVIAGICIVIMLVIIKAGEKKAAAGRAKRQARAAQAQQAKNAPGPSGSLYERYRKEEKNPPKSGEEKGRENS